MVFWCPDKVWCTNVRSKYGAEKMTQAKESNPDLTYHHTIVILCSSKKSCPHFFLQGLLFLLFPSYFTCLAMAVCSKKMLYILGLFVSNTSLFHGDEAQVGRYGRMEINQLTVRNTFSPSNFMQIHVFFPNIWWPSKYPKSIRFPPLCDLLKPLKK